MSLHGLLKALLLPPLGLLWPILLGAFWWRQPVARGLVLAGALGLLVLALPIVPARLMALLEPYPALSAKDLAHPGVEAIVVLGAGRYSDAPEYGHDDLGPLTLQRIRYAAWLQRRTRLPLVVCGGSPPSENPPLARIMARVLEREFGVPVAAVEDHSRTTRENAHYAAPILRRHGWRRIWLVSHAWHLPRAVEAFRHAGIEVVPAPTAFIHRDDPGTQPGDFLPSAKAWLGSYYALHELIGRAWYRFLGWWDATVG